MAGKPNAKRKASGKTYMLGTCAADMTSHGGFKWPTKGSVKCPDWSPRAECGNGLHGLLMGAGNGNYLSRDPDAIWLVVEIDAKAVVEIGGKIKVPAGRVIFAGDKFTATEKIIGLGANRATCVGATAMAGDRGTAMAGDLGTATAGNSGTATAGNRGTATAGYSGTATAGDFGTATAGNSGTATAGNRGTATAGYSGTATAGESGTATAGYSGTASGKVGSIICIKWWDEKKYRYCMTVGYPGEDGIELDTKYRVDARGRFVKA